MFYGWADRPMRNCHEKFFKLVAQAFQPVQTGWRARTPAYLTFQALRLGRRLIRDCLSNEERNYRANLLES